MTVKEAIIYLIVMWIVYNIIMGDGDAERKAYYYTARVAQWSAYRIGLVGLWAENQYITVTETGR